ncbi:T9SS type A sorting domain-containing protein [Gilvibacter sediminis]|uniref:T9SS type A sorting domain-containing protein n=1 Tax=Gilvibacter sediminis TaxID=379071 RepID=UPI002350BE7B|nr:T9SS type A sorting domain-containing protein [Gilvibacter sediminis]MDC7997794.1 T9SS type A sorting domain-containing protein [Gilvibacter sediminis]
MKKLLLFSCFAAGLTSAFAQLTVRPNPTSSTDSYIYVNDEVLYVDDEINLTLNTYDPTTEASIYLRGDSQLIQGNTGSSPNSGTGLLSVYQQGFADSYEYNFWASPIGSASGAAGNEYFGIRKFYDVVDVTDSNQATRTTAFNGSSSPLTISTRWIWKFTAGTTYSDWVYVGQNTTVAPGQGFTMKGVDVGADLATTPQQEYDFRGKPNSGDITNAVLEDQLTLIGNPYPSAVDLQEFFDGNPDVDAQAFYWEQDHSVNSHYLNAYQGGYAVWTADGTADGFYQPAIFLSYAGDGSSGPPTGTSGTALIQRRYAPIGQGFMVRGAADGTVTMRDEYREYVVEGASTFSEFKSGSADGSAAMVVDGTAADGDETARQKERPFVRITAFINDNFASPLALLFFDKATFGEDRGMDAKSPRDFENDIYWSISDDPDNEYIIQTVPFDRGAMIPLGFKVGSTSDFRLYITERAEFSKDMYLYDAVNDTYRLFSKENYIEINDLAPGVYEDRFFVAFNKRAHEGEAATAAVEAKVQIFQNNPSKQLEILNDEALVLESATLYDINGRILWTRNDLGANSRYAYPTSLLADGIYILRLQTKDGAVKTEKIRVFNK